MTGVGRPAGNDHVWLFGECLLPYLIHVHTHGLWVNAVGRDLIQLAGEVQLHAMGQVAAMSQRQAHDLLPRVCQRHEYCGVGLRAGMWLNVGVVGTEDVFGASYGQVLHNVHVFTATVVPTSRVTFSVFVGQYRSLSLKHSTRNKILRSDHFQRIALAGKFPGHCCGHLGVQR